MQVVQVVQTSLLVRLHQQSLASACERFHEIGPRLARWLLMSHDRAQAGAFHVTQEFIALELTVQDRPALEAQACSCYAADQRLYAELTEGAA